MKNQVTKAKFLDWYFDDYEMVLNLGERCADMLIEKGVITLTPEDLFNDCGYIPAQICVGQENAEYSEYDTQDVELI